MRYFQETNLMLNRKMRTIFLKVVNFQSLCFEIFQAKRMSRNVKVSIFLDNPASAV